MKIKTADLIGPALDWAVAKCEGYSIELENDGRFWITRTNHAQQYLPPFGYLDETFFPSSDWSQGGSIIEREWIELGACHDQWRAVFHGEDGSIYQDGPTPLIAAMRCFIASKLGNEIEIPEELL